MRILVTLLAAGLVLASCEPPSEDTLAEPEASGPPSAEGPSRRQLATCTGTDATAPQVLLTSPSSGASLTGTVTLTATASDDVGVTKVEFFLGNRSLGTDSTAPYELVWNSANLSNGAGTLTARAYDAACNQGVSTPVDVTVQNAGNAAFDATRGAPSCATVGNKCDSMELLDGRGGIGPELNQPNTLSGSCADGTDGTYHSSPSLDRLVIFRSDGTAFAAGKEVTVQATVYASTNYAQEALDLYLAPDANSPNWTLVGTLTPPGSGIRALSATYLLPTVGLQALRGVYRSGGATAAACAPGALNDHDDLLLAVGFEADTTPPSVVITSPVAHSSTSADGTSTIEIPTVSGVVTVTASASDNFGVQRVELYDGSSLVATDDRAPYAFSWATMGVPNGTHTLTVRAYDVTGNVSTSSGVTVYVDNDHTAPQVTLTNLWDGEPVSGTLSLTASASDDRSLARVDYSVDGTFIGSASANPYTVSWNSRAVSNGPHTLAAVAYDAAGNASAPSTVSVQVDNDYTPPQTAITYPATGATLKDNVTLQATASDDHGVVRVEFYANNYWAGSTTTAPYSVYWDTRQVHNGTYTLTSKAYDAAGNVSTSAPVSVTVSNPGVADFDPGLGAPRCPGLATYCNSLDLLLGRGQSRPEQHAPNTLDGCQDGYLGGGYYDLESIEQIRVSTSDGAPMAAGKRLTINVQAWVRGYQADSLDLYYTADATHPSWTYLTTLRASYSGLNWFSANYILPAGDLQAVRANFRSLGSVSPCSPGSSDDHDDLVFPVFTDTTPPAVSITAPVSGATASGTVTVTASVTDNGTVKAVDFYDGQTLIGTNTWGPPYTVNWATRSGANGSHTLTAQARDAAGNVGNSAPVTVTVNNDLTAPTVSLSAPVNGATVMGPVMLSASATDDRAVTKVEFYDGTRLLGTDTSAPYIYPWATGSEATGQHTLTATAYDAAGNVGSSAPVTVTVARDTTPPSVALTAPAAGATLTGTVTLSASATDDVGVSKVEFLLDGTVLATSTSAPYSFSWNTKTASNGSHTLSVRGTDSSGNVATSAAAGVTLDNDLTAPTVSISAPVAGATVAGDVTVQMSAADDRAVAQVRLRVDGNAWSTVTTAPYVTTWMTRYFGNGPHTLTAEATDTSGNVATSAPVSVMVYNDTTPPTVVITSPANGSEVSGLVSIQLSTTDDVGVTGLDFLANGMLIGGGATPPFSLDWNTDGLGNGSYTLTVRARDAAGNTAMSAPVTVTINQPGRAAFDSTLHAPLCSALGASCDTMNLVQGRGASFELNSPNTLDGCADGQVLDYSFYEKINRIKVSRVGGALLEEGRPAHIDVDVIAYATTVDALDLFYTSDATHPAWTYLTTLTSSVSGAVTLSADFTLPAGSLQAVRAQFRKFGSSGTACSSGTYDDHDDVAFAVNRPLDVEPPTVALTSPASSAWVGGVVPVSAAASDDVVVARVEFYADGALIGTDTAAPYTVNWNSATVAEGAHTLTAKAYDGAGHVGSSAPVVVNTDNTLPAAALTSPTSAASVRDTVVLTATASDNQGIARVEFYDGATLISTDVDAPYTASWNTAGLTNGGHTLTVKAFDLVGNVRTSAGVSVYVDSIAPTVSLLAPGQETRVGRTVQVSASASDNVGVARVEFYANGALIGTASGAVYSVDWFTTGLAEGQYTLTAKAIDYAGNATTSGGVTVTVDNTAPAVSLVSPVQGAKLRGSVLLMADASDNGGINRVEFYANGALVGTTSLDLQPYRVPWDTTSGPNGSVTLTAQAYDMAGNMTQSASVTVTVDNAPPAVAITSPANGASLSSLLLSTTVSASASDNVGVTKVEFYDGATLMGTDTTSPYSVSWNLLSAAKGNHTLTAKAYDAAGNVTTSAANTVKVN